MNICIMGGGNGAYAAAAHLTLLGHNIRLFSPQNAELTPIVKQGGITLKGILGNQFVPNISVFMELGPALMDVDLIMLVVPSLAHTSYAQLLAPLIQDNTFILLNPGHTGGALNVAETLKQAGSKAKVHLAEINTLTYFTRKTGDSEVSIYQITDRLIFSALPATDTPYFYQKIQDLYPQIKLGYNILETSLTNHNAILHPAAMILNGAYLERTAGDFLFYNEGTTPAVGEVMATVDQERIALLKALGLPVISFREDFYQGGYTTKEAYQSGSYFRLVQESPVNKNIKAPPSLQHRFLEEDIAYGLVPMFFLGQVCGIAMPLSEALITIAGAINGKNYFDTGLNLAKLGLTNLNKEEILEFVQTG